MTAVPAHERLPSFKAPWLQVWRDALAKLKVLDVWRPELRPLLDEYVAALQGACEAREGFESLDRLRRVTSRDEVDWEALRRLASGLPTVWDRHTRRAASLADQLCLTPRAEAALRRGLARQSARGDGDRFAELDNVTSFRRRIGSPTAARPRRARDSDLEKETI